MRWQFAYPGSEGHAGPAGAVQITEPWGHLVEHTLESGRTSSIEEELVVVRDDGPGTAEMVEWAFTYTDDGRVSSAMAPDGGEHTYSYADGDRMQSRSGRPWGGGSARPRRTA